MKSSHFFGIFAGFLFFLFPQGFGHILTAQSPTTLIYPRPVSDLDRRSEYPVKLLELALKKAGGSYLLKESSAIMNKARVSTELEDGKNLDIAWMVTSEARENSLLPVRICLFKGLIGWRIFLIRKDDLTKFSKITSLEELKKLSAGQGDDWSDTPVLQAAGIKVITSPVYDSLFTMLANKRFDWFPRSVPEIWKELEDYGKLGIVVEPKLLLRYPEAYYYFVNKNNPKLAATIEKGLRIALADGSFDKLLFEYHGNIVELADLKSRKILDLNNPFIPPLTPLNDKDIWFDLKKYPKP